MVYPFLGIFQQGLGVSLQTMSIAMTARALAGAFGPFLASIADSRGRKTGMLFGLSLYVLGIGAVVLWPSFTTFILAVIFATIGKYVFDPSMQALLGDRVPYEQRGLVMGLSELSWSLGFILGVPLVGFLLARNGWVAPFPLLLILGALALAAIALILPNDANEKQAHSGALASLKLVFTSAPALLALAMCMFISAGNEAINLVFGIWLEDSFGLKIAALGAATAVIGLSELSGEALVVTLTDRLGKSRAVGLGLAANSITAVALPLIGDSVAGAFLGLFLFYITFEFTLVSSIPWVSEILPAGRATIMGANVAGHSLGRALGALIATQVYTLTNTPGLPLSGIQGNILLALFFNSIAFFALYKLRRTTVKV
jgi:predicted MFS family arabinose efflux permease